MKLNEAKEWFSFIQEAPESIRDYLIGTFWLLVFLLLVWAILKLLFNKEFKQLYNIISKVLGTAGSISKQATVGAARSLELPEPYPRAKRFFEIVFMLNNYAAFFLFTCIFLTLAFLFISSESTSFLQRTGGMVFTFVIGYFAWFFFAEAERDKVRLFKHKDEEAKKDAQKIEEDGEEIKRNEEEGS